MKKNAFTDLLFNYENMSRDKKLQRLQDLENMMARMQGRTPRTVTMKNNRFKQEIEEAKKEGRVLYAFYSKMDNKYLHITELKCDSMDIIKDIIHEGWHAYVDDFLNRGITLNLFSKIDKEDFLLQQKLMPELWNYLKKNNLIKFFDWCSAEERINYHENSLYLVYLLLDAIESVEDAEKIRPMLIGSFSYATYNEERASDLEKEKGVTFRQLTAELNKKENPEIQQFRKLGKIKDEYDPEFAKFGQEMYENIRKVSLKDKSNLKIEDDILEKVFVLCSQYLSKTLSDKLNSSRKKG